MSRKLKPQPKVTVAKKQPPRWQRERNISLVIRIIIPLIIVSALGLVGYWGYDTYVTPWQQTVAKVNDTTIDMRYYVKMLRFYSWTSGVAVNDISFPYQVLRVIEDNEVIRQGASMMDIKVTSEEITETIENDLLAGQGNATLSQSDLDKLYDQRLDRARLSDQEYRRIVETSLLGQKLREYLKQQEVPKQAKHVHLYTIQLDTEDEALDALAQLQKGNLTLATAGNVTVTDAGNVTRSIQVDDRLWVPQGIYPEYDAVAFSLEAGNLTGPILTDQGYSLIEVSDIAESMTVSDQHQETLTDLAFEKWLQEQREASIIEEYLDQDKINWAVDHI